MLEDIGYWIIRTYLAGGVGEKTKFYMPADRSRSKRAQASELRKQEQNESNVTRRVARMFNEYFSSADYLIGLDLSPAGMERVQAGAERIRGKKPRDDYTDEDYIRLSTAHEGELFIRRLKKHLPEDTEIRYVAFASDREKNKRTGDLEPCRAHLHIVLSACGDIAAMKTLCADCWSWGGVHLEHLYQSPDYWTLAEYLVEQVRRIKDAKAYKPSRNMPLPLPKDRVSHSEAELRLPKGATFLRRGEYKAGEPQYLRYLVPKKDGECKTRIDRDPSKAGCGRGGDDGGGHNRRQV